VGGSGRRKEWKIVSEAMVGKKNEADYAPGSLSIWIPVFFVLLWL
jgi:hypothetical protein